MTLPSQPPTGSQREPEAEDQGEQRREDEIRNHDAGHGRPHRRIVGGGILAQRGQRADRDAGDERQQHGDAAQAQRDRKAAGDQLGDGEILVLQRGSEIAVHQAAEIAQELHRQRLIQVIGMDQPRLDLRRDHALLVEGAARGDAHQEEGEGDDQQQRRDGAEKTLGGKSEHRESGPARDGGPDRPSAVPRRAESERPAGPHPANRVRTSSR